MRIRTLAFLPLAALLSACWQSDGPLIPDNQADSPNVAGTYARKPADPGIALSTTTIAKGAAGFFEYDDLDTAGARVKYRLRFDRLTDDWYLVQSQTREDGKDVSLASANYRIVKISGRTIQEYEPDCGLAEEMAPSVDVSDGNCSFSDYFGLVNRAQARVNDSLSGDTGSLSLQATYTKK